MTDGGIYREIAGRPHLQEDLRDHPIGVWCDNTTELLAATLRPGNAGSTTTTDHIDLLTAAITQVPAGHRKKLLIRADGAGTSHGLLDWLNTLNTAPVHGGPPMLGPRPRRPAAANALTDADRAQVLTVLTSDRFVDKSVAQVWADLTRSGHATRRCTSLVQA